MMQTRQKAANFTGCGVINEGLTIDCYSNSANIIVDTLSGEREITFYPSIALHLKKNNDYDAFIASQEERDFSHVNYIIPIAD